MSDRLELADIALLRGIGSAMSAQGYSPDGALVVRAADALAALGDTVPHNDSNAAMTEAWYRAARERDEARAERDALAHVIEQAQAMAGLLRPWDVPQTQLRNLGRILATAPAVSLALHDAEVWDEGVRAKSASSSIFDADVFAQNPYRAAAIREEVE